MPYPDCKLHAAIGLISAAPSGSSAHRAWMLPTPYPAYKLHAAVGLIAQRIRQLHVPMPDAANALSGLQTTRSRRPDKHSAIRQLHVPMPDAANALSGLQTTYSRRPDKHSASGSYTSPCRMRLTPYPAYKLHAAVGLISTAPSGSSEHRAWMLPMPYPAYKLHTAVGLISCGNIGIWQIRPYPARFYLWAPDTPYLTASTHLQRALSPARRHFVRHALRLRLSGWLLHPTDESPMPAKSAQR